MAYIEVTEPAMLDSTGQDIKDSIDALATALTTDKANRDASNVTNASAWRSAIGVHYVKTTATSNANGYIDLGIPSATTMLLSVIANGVGAIPMQSGNNWWCILVNPSTMQPYPSLSRTIWYEYIDI